MKRAILAVMTLAAMASSAGAQEPPATDILGKKAPDFTLPSVTDSTPVKFKLSTLKGKVVVLDFWAVWCGPCTDSMPFFQKLSDSYRTKGLEVVGLHVDDRMPEPKEVKAFLDELGVRYRNLVSTAEVDDSYLVYAMPTTYILDRNGVVQKRHIGFNPKTAPERIERDVKDLLSR